MKTSNRTRPNVLFHFSGAAHTSWDLLHGYRPSMVFHSRRKCPICNCVHSYSISPSQTSFFKSMSFAQDGHRTNKNDVHTGARCPLSCPSTRSRACTRAPARVRILVWVCLEKKGVFTLVPSEYRTRAPCPGTKCEGCLTFPRALKEIGHVCRHAG